MFTGLVQAVGRLQWVSDYQVQIHCPGATLAQIAVGDSIAVDGVCLTVEKILPQGFIASASPETLRRTTLGNQATLGAKVNLEASLRVGDKLGGHFVTGHVDGTGCLQSRLETASSWEMSFTATAPMSRYIVAKGSIAVNGISLTVADCDPEGTWFKAAVIPHSFATTNLQDLQPGSCVNLEGDLLGKYAEKILRLGNPPPPSHTLPESQPDAGITPGFLAEHGFL